MGTAVGVQWEMMPLCKGEGDRQGEGLSERGNHFWRILLKNSTFKYYFSGIIVEIGYLGGKCQL